jgi:hypothetical protein
MGAEGEHTILPGNKESEEKEKGPADSVYGHVGSFRQCELAIL